jgi:hypothetical protein
MFLAALLLAEGLGAGRARAAMEAWRPYTAAELAARASTLDPDAPAEVLDWSTQMDRSGMPFTSGFHQYIRYKVYDPDKVLDITRVTETTASFDGTMLADMDVRARLINPDGTTKLFGKESVQERNLLKNGTESSWVARLFGTEGLRVKEKFLAVSGIKAGSILEFQYDGTQKFPSYALTFVMQKEGIPVRHATFELRPPDPHFCTSYPVILNAKDLNVTYAPDLKKKSVVVTAVDLPAAVTEPFQGPLFNRAVTFVATFQPRNQALMTNHAFTNTSISGGSTPWLGIMFKADVLERDVTGATSEITALAASITAGASSRQERAVRIHAYVRDLYGKFMKSERHAAFAFNVPAPTMDKVVHFEKFPKVFISANDFLFLAIALYRADGFEAQELMLPNKSILRFSMEIVSEAYLPDRCAQVFVGDKWMYSMPQSQTPLPFGWLPAENRGGVALAVKDVSYSTMETVDFIEVPEAFAPESVSRNSGDLTLAPDGSLSGTCRRELSGEQARVLRKTLRDLDADARTRRLEADLGEELKADSVGVSSLKGVDEPEAPLAISFTFHCADYAETTRSRLIFRPSVFHGLTPSPFSSGTRRSRIIFPYRWTEEDHLTLHLPAGFELESASSAPSQPGESFSYVTSIEYRSREGSLVFDRSFACNDEQFLAEGYPTLKAWFDTVAESDAHQLVLVKKDAGPPPPAAAPTS